MSSKLNFNILYKLRQSDVQFAFQPQNYAIQAFSISFSTKEKLSISSSVMYLNL